MIRMLALLVRRPDLSRDAFRSHYEGQHAPLALPLLDGVRHYVRNHVAPGLDAGRCPFDVLSEFGYESQAAVTAVAARLDSERGEAIREDERRFMDKPRNRFFPLDLLERSTGRSEHEARPSRQRVALLSRRSQPSAGPEGQTAGRVEGAHLAAVADLARAGAAVTSWRAVAAGAVVPWPVLSFVDFVSPRHAADALRAWRAKDLDTLRINVVVKATRTDPGWSAT